MASKGRNGDSMLVHMTPGEVAGLHALALKHGGELTINPDTGLPEANFLKSLLPMLAGAALNFFVPGLGAAVGGTFGLGAAAGTGIAVGGLTTLATGSLSRGLMAGMGAYGGAGLTEGLMGAGAQELAATGIPMAENVAGAAIPPIEQINPSNFAMSNADKLSTGIQGLGTEAGRASALANMGGASNAFKYAAGAAAPIMADMMVPTTTKMPDAQNPGYIRQKVFDPGSQTYRDLTPVKANEFKDRSFSDIYRGYNTGGIVALAAGGAGTDAVAGAAAPQTVADLYASIGRTPDAAGQAFWESAFGKGPVTADQAASFMQSANAVKAQEAAAAPAVIAPTTITTPTGGVTNLVPATNVADTTGITALQPQAVSSQPSVLPPPTQTSTADAQTAVNNIYRNVLGRDADPVGLNFWSNAIASGRSVDSVYQDILKSANEIKTAGTLGDFGIKTMTAADAAKPYTGYTSTAGATVADEFVRNVLGREPTDADRAQSWYKEASNLGTTADASKVYSDFLKSAGTEASSNVARKIADAKALLASKGLTEDDVVKQTNKTIAQLVTSGVNLDLGFMQAAQLKSLGSAPAGFDFSTITKPKKPVASTFDTTNPYGNNTGNALTSTPGDLTYNQDGTITVQPNVPGGPFTGMTSVKDAYTAGGGSLGYTPYVPKTAAEHAILYNNLTGDSEAAYRFLMGEGAYPTKSRVGEIARPYREATMGYPTSTNKAYNYDAATGKMVRNPDYVAPGRDAEGNVNYTMSLNEMKKYLTANPLSGQALYDWAQENGASAQDIADATGRKLSEVYTEFRDASKKAAAAKVGTGVGASGVYDSGGGDGTAAPPGPPGPPGPPADSTSPANSDPGNTTAKRGGMMGYAVGGGLGSLGTYSDGGRLLKGPGDGVSDSIPATIGRKQQPARLADGEFVVPARIVSELGNGSTEAGAKKLYAMMDRVQRARGKTTGKNKVAANSRADKYLPA
jgi:hypothetical protein